LHPPGPFIYFPRAASQMMIQGATMSDIVAAQKSHRLARRGKREAFLTPS